MKRNLWKTLAGIVIVGSLFGSCDLVRPTGTFDAFVWNITLTGVPASQFIYLSGNAAETGYEESSVLSGLNLQTQITEVESFRLEVHYPQEGSIVLSESFSGTNTNPTFVVSPSQTLSKDKRLLIRIVDESDWFGKEWFRAVW